MNKHEFIANLEAYKKGEGRRLLSMLPRVFLPIVLYTGFVMIADYTLDLPGWLSTTLYFSGMGIFFVLIFTEAKKEKRELIDVGLCCPKCKKPITPQEGGIVVATNNCPHCGEQILTEPAG